MYFELEEKGYKWFNGSRPLLSRSGCISQQTKNRILEQEVLVPFYRGAVVFSHDKNMMELFLSSRPLLSRSGCIYEVYKQLEQKLKRSRPLLSRSGCIYKDIVDVLTDSDSSRPLLSRSGCI